MVQIKYFENAKIEIAIVQDTAVTQFCENKMVISIKRLSN